MTTSYPRKSKSLSIALLMPSSNVASPKHLRVGQNVWF